MNDPPHPISADQVDELLSAELDGEFDAAAADMGFGADEARTLLAAAPGVEARRASLVRARDALSELPEIDELMAARLRAKATRAGEQTGREQHAQRAHRWQRALAVTGAVAATAAIVVGIAAAVRNGNGSASKNKASASAAGAHAPAATPTTAPSSEQDSLQGGGAQGVQASAPVDFGSVPDVETLAARVESEPQARAAAGTTSPTESQTTSGPSSQPADGALGAPVTVTDGSAPLSSSYKSADGVQKSVAPIVERCDVTARQLAGVTTAAIVRGVATLGGSQVSVELFVKNTDRVLVILTAECHLVNLRTISA